VERHAASAGDPADLADRLDRASRIALATASGSTRPSASTLT
jgi:hypothetical protein